MSCTRARRLVLCARTAAADAGKPETWWDGRPFHAILLDAPCSGVGTWQRNPHARWTTQPEDVQELARVQMKLLKSAAVKLKPGGRLIYAVCTLTRSETVDVAKAFAAAHPQFTLLPVSTRL